MAVCAESGSNDPQSTTIQRACAEQEEVGTAAGAAARRYVVYRDQTGRSARVKRRGVTKPLTLNVHFLGTWQTPWWEDGVDKGPKTRAGFVATSLLDRKDFGVSWNSVMDRGGLVVADDVEITLDAEAILEDNR